jgi:DNA-binding transcriptional regulator YhcF (GntR family)
MEWRLDKNRAICPQICDTICVMIASGDITPGEKLTSVREVAAEADVTPNTVQKAYVLLEQRGVIYSKRSSGWYVSDRVDIAKDILTNLIHTKTADYLNDMQNLGLDKKEVIAIIKNLRYS